MLLSTYQGKEIFFTRINEVFDHYSYSNNHKKSSIVTLLSKVFVRY